MKNSEVNSTSQSNDESNDNNDSQSSNSSTNVNSQQSPETSNNEIGNNQNSSTNHEMTAEEKEEDRRRRNREAVQRTRNAQAAEARQKREELDRANTKISDLQNRLVRSEQEKGVMTRLLIENTMQHHESEKKLIIENANLKLLYFAANGATETAARNVNFNAQSLRSEIAINEPLLSQNGRGRVQNSNEGEESGNVEGQSNKEEERAGVEATPDVVEGVTTRTRTYYRTESQQPNGEIVSRRGVRIVNSGKRARVDNSTNDNRKTDNRKTKKYGKHSGYRIGPNANIHFGSVTYNTIPRSVQDEEKTNQNHIQSSISSNQTRRTIANLDQIRPPTSSFNRDDKE